MQESGGENPAVPDSLLHGAGSSGTRSAFLQDTKRPWSRWLPGAVLLTVAGLALMNGFTLFHTLVEFFAVAVAIFVFLVAWYTYGFSRNGFLLVIGGTYLWVGIADFLHALAFAGLLPGDLGTPNGAVLFWMCARSLEALGFLTAPAFLGKSPSRWRALLFPSLVGVVSMGSVLAGMWPPLYVAGEGLAPGKVFGEYLLIGVLLVGFVRLWKKSAWLSPGMFRLLALALLVTMAAEFCFTLYVGVTDLPMVLGHALKLLSFWLIYVGVIDNSLAEPYAVMTRASSSYDSIPDPTMVVSPSGEIVHANLAAARIMGCSPERSVGLHIHPIFHDADVSVTSCQLCLSLAKIEAMAPTEFCAKPGVKWYDVSHTPLRASGIENLTVVVMRDVSSRCIARLEAQSARQRLESFVRAASDFFWEVDEAGRTLYISRRFFELSRSAINDIEGKPLVDLFRAPEQEEEGSGVDDKPSKPTLAQFLAAQQIFRDAVVRFSCKDGPDLHLRLSGVPKWDETGHFQGFHGTGTDFSAQMTAEKDKQEAEGRLRHAQKMEAVGALTGGVAHDFNNILAVIMGNLHLLEEDCREEKETHELVTLALAAAERGAELTRRLLAFSRQQSLAPTLVNLNDVVDTMVKLLSRSLGESVSIAKDLDTSPLRCVLDPTHLEHVLVNLAVNSRDAMPDGGVLTIKTKRIMVGKPATDEDLPAGSYCMVAVEDTGTGMDSATVDRVFEPFFSTKPQGKGTGLGLSMAYGFVGQSGGHIRVTSAVGEGTQVRIYLPEASQRTIEEVPEQPHAPDNGRRAQGQREAKPLTFLLVEDDPLVQGVTRAMLERMGHSVIPANSGQEALDIAKSNKAFDIVFSDIVLGSGMNGLEVGRQLASIRPQTPCLFMTGYSPDLGEGEDRRVPAGLNVLQKPFTPAALEASVTKLINDEPGL